LGGERPHDGQQSDQRKEEKSAQIHGAQECISNRKGGRNPAGLEDPVVHSDPEVMGGEPVFVGTRVLVRSLFEYLEAGDSLEIFLDAFPSVTRGQAIGALEIASKAVST